MGEPSAVVSAPRAVPRDLPNVCIPFDGAPEVVKDMQACIAASDWSPFAAKYTDRTDPALKGSFEWGPAGTVTPSEFFHGVLAASVVLRRPDLISGMTKETEELFEAVSKSEC